MLRTRPKGRRNERRWYEDDALAILAKATGESVIVRVRSMRGDTPEGEVIYGVEELRSRECYPASDREMKPCTLTHDQIKEHLEKGTLP